MTGILNVTFTAPQRDTGVGASEYRRADGPPACRPSAAATAELAASSRGVGVASAYQSVPSLDGPRRAIHPPWPSRPASKLS
jgi:hypothetical protein